LGLIAHPNVISDGKKNMLLMNVEGFGGTYTSDGLTTS